MILDPRRISSALRSQTLIEEAMQEAGELEQSVPFEQLTTDQCIDLALVYVECGNFEKMTRYAERAFSCLMTANGIEAAVAPNAFVGHYVDAIDSHLSREQQEAMKESLATILYLFSVRDREKNVLGDANRGFDKALGYAHLSPWLHSNLLRGRGLVALKQELFTTASQLFRFALRIAMPDRTLAGSLPALSNYVTLAFARDAMKNMHQAKEIDGLLEAFDTVSCQYAKYFEDHKLDQTARNRSHDYQSHLFHYAMFLLEVALFRNDRSLTEAALSKLLAVQAARQANKADAQRLGDIAYWIGRAHLGLNNREAAQDALNRAQDYYEECGFTTDSKQVEAVTAALDSIFAKEASPRAKSPLAQNSLLRSGSSSPTAEADQADLRRSSVI